MNSLKIALLQIMSGNNIEENRRIGEEACRKAKLFDADIVLFPEMWSCGYSFPENPAELEELAVNADGEFVSFNPAYDPIVPGDYDDVRIAGIVRTCRKP